MSFELRNETGRCSVDLVVVGDELFVKSALADFGSNDCAEHYADLIERRVGDQVSLVLHDKQRELTWVRAEWTGSDWKPLPVDRRSAPYLHLIPPIDDLHEWKIFVDRSLKRIEALPSIGERLSRLRDLREMTLGKIKEHGWTGAGGDQIAEVLATAKRLMRRDRMIFDYVAGMDAGDVRRIGAVLASAEYDPDLDRIIGEIDQEFQWEEFNG